MTEKLKVVIDARLVDGLSGGVQQIVLGLAHGLSALQDGDEEYLFLTYRDASGWLLPHLKGPCRELPGPPAGNLKDSLRAFAPTALRDAWDRSRFKAFVRTPHLPASDGLAEASGAAVVHFPFQSAFRTRLPSIYMPQDLQHCHFPGYFSPYALKSRDAAYRGFCEQAALVAVMSRFGKRDLLRQFGSDPSKVAVIAGASMLEAYALPEPGRIQAFKQEHGLPEAYLVYSAQTFPHKNHLGLLRAMALLRDSRGLAVQLVFPGRRNEHFPVIETEMKRLGLENQCRFLGHLGPDDIQCVYASARGMIIPSLFEGWGLPLTEAMQAGLPVAVADNSMLPEQGGDAVLAFDAQDTAEMAGALERLWTDEAFRQDLSCKGRLRVQAFSWERTARSFRAHYRRLAGQDLSGEDQALVRKSFSNEALA